MSTTTHIRHAGALLLAALAAAFACAFALGTNWAYAAEDNAPEAALSRLVGTGAIDPAAKGSLTLDYLSAANAPLANVAVHIYKVADVAPEVTFSSEFANLGVTWPDAGPNADAAALTTAWEAVAQTLQQAVSGGTPAPLATQQTNEQGRAAFTDLAPAVYLVIANPYQQGNTTYTFLPSLISVPNGYVGDALNYDVVASPKPEVTTTEPAAYKVVKRWDDAGKESARPASISIVIYRDGKEFAKETLNADNNWTYEWQDAEGGHTFTCDEEVPAGYTKSIQLQDGTFVITNKVTPTTPTPPTPTSPTPTSPTPTPTPSTQTKLPKTGDTWWPIAPLVCIGLLALGVGIVALAKSRRDNRDNRADPPHAARSQGGKH